MQSSKNHKTTKNNLQLQHTKPSISGSNTFASLLKSIQYRQQQKEKQKQRQKHMNLTNKQNYQNNQQRYSFKTKSIRPQVGEREMARSSLVGSFLQVRERQRDKERQKMKQSIYQQNIESLLYKIKKYISITEPILRNNGCKLEERLRKQGVNTVCQIVEIVTNMEENASSKKGRDQSSYSSLNSTGNIFLGANKSLSSSFHFNNGLPSNQDSANFIRKIENLQQQKMHLQSKISQQQRANIKMFIKLNQGQSKQIQKYKKQLSSLYQKYKQLQKLVKKQSQKSRSLQLRLDQSKKLTDSQNITQINFKKEYQKIYELVTQQNQCLAKAYADIQNLKERLQKQKIIENQLLYQIAQFQRKERNQQNLRHSICNNDFSKSVSSCATIQSGKNKNVHKNIEHDTSQIFQNVVLKPQSNVKSQSDLLRFLFSQACIIESVLKK